MYPDQVRRTVVVVGLLAVAALLVACGANDSPAAAQPRQRQRRPRPHPRCRARPRRARRPSRPVVPRGHPAPALRVRAGRDRSRGRTSSSTAKGRSPKPDADGWIVRHPAEPASGRTARSRRSTSSTCITGCGSTRRRQDTTIPALPERFFAAGEEKTTIEFPPGYGYPYQATDHWVLNYMLHNLTPKRDTGVGHLRHRLRPGDRAGRSEHQGRAPDLDRRAERQRSTRCSTCIKGTGTDGDVHLPRRRPEPVRRGRRRTSGPSTRRRAGRRRPATCTPAACTTTCYGSTRGGQTDATSSRPKAQLLRARGRGVVGRRR